MKRLEYSFSFLLNKQGGLKSIAKDILTLDVELSHFEKAERDTSEENPKRDVHFVITNENGKLGIALSPKSIEEERMDKSLKTLLSILQERDVPPRTLMLEHSDNLLFLFGGIIRHCFEDFSTFDFDPKLSKRATPMEGRVRLDEDGSNLAIVLGNILSEKEEKRMFGNLISDILPFVKAMKTQRFADKSLQFKVKETFDEDSFIPAFWLSDGTINIVALIAALYFDKKGTVTVEEPERNIHPALLSRVVDMFRDVSRNRQVIFTTHSPELLKHAGLENALLISRKKNGYSQITRPADNEAVKVFLEEDLGVDEIFIQDLLTA